MQHITIFYLLSEEGQREALRRGIDAARVRWVACPSDCLEVAAELAFIEPDGEASVFIGGRTLYRRGDTGWTAPAPLTIPGPWKVEEGFGNVTAGPRLGHCCSESYPMFNARQNRVAAPTFNAPLVADSEITGALHAEAVRREGIEQSKAQAEQEAAQRTAEAEPLKAEAQAKVAAWIEAEAKRAQAREADREVKAEAKRAKAEAKRTEAEAWIREHGSAHLQEILAENLLDGSMGTYRTERLAKERPGWIYDRRWYAGEVSYEDPRNPEPADLALLRAARETASDAELRWAELGNEPDECSYPEPYVREIVAVAEFLDQMIVLRKEALAELHTYLACEHSLDDNDEPSKRVVAVHRGTLESARAWFLRPDGGQRGHFLACLPDAGAEVRAGEFIEDYGTVVIDEVGNTVKEPPRGDLEVLGKPGLR